MASNSDALRPHDDAAHASGDQSAAKGVADRVRELRLGLGLNQTEFARAIGASRSYLSDVENRKAKVSVDLLFDIVARFREKADKATLGWLLTGRAEPVPWGEEPSLSPLNSILGLDRRALAAAIECVDALDREQAIPLPPKAKARLLVQALYVYISEMMRARQAGIDPDRARQIAQAACDSIVSDYGVPEETGPSMGGV
nr:helix-turn-helix transcriptional regulator [uncultured Rhodopila sp.]